MLINKHLNPPATQRRFAKINQRFTHLKTAFYFRRVQDLRFCLVI